MEWWYVVINGKPQGPYSKQDLQNLNISQDTFLRSDTMDDYKEAHEIPEIRSLLHFAHYIAEPQYFATLDIRLLATAIDYLIVGGIYIILALAFTMFTSDNFYRIAVSAAGLVLLPIIKCFYAISMESSERQGTYGKYWLGIKVCDEKGLPLKAGKAFARNVLKITGILTLGIGFLMGFFDRRQQCLHDRLAGTVVTKDRLL